MTRESKNIIPPSPSDAAPVVGHVNNQHSQKNKERLFTQLENYEGYELQPEIGDQGSLDFGLYLTHTQGQNFDR